MSENNIVDNSSEVSHRLDNSNNCKEAAEFEVDEMAVIDLAGISLLLGESIIHPY